MRIPIFRISQANMTKSLCFRSKDLTKVPSRDEWRENIEIRRNNRYTNGSRTENGTEFGICRPNHHMKTAFKLIKFNIVFQAEMVAIET